MKYQNSSVVKELESLLEEMDIPRNRTYINYNNLKWLNKNLKTRNQSHPKFKRVMELVNTALEQKLYQY